MIPVPIPEVLKLPANIDYIIGSSQLDTWILPSPIGVWAHLDFVVHSYADSFGRPLPWYSGQLGHLPEIGGDSVSVGASDLLCLPKLLVEHPHHIRSDVRVSPC